MYLGNFLERLADVLIEDLYAGSPFTKRLVVLPDMGLKNFLMRRIASRFEVAAAVEFATLAQLYNLPCSIELSFFLEGEILKHLDEQPFAPLKKYIEGPSSQRRLSQLCDRIARLFIQHGAYGAKIKEVGWQMQLWKAMQKRWPAKAESAELYFFGFHFLPDFKKGARFYLFSPCQAYWGDYSPQEFEAEQNALLASLGKVGRKMLQLTAEEQFEECYEEPGTANDLAYLQQQILQGDPIQPLTGDGSIEIFSAPTPWEEIEILRKKIRELGLEPNQIQVFAPNISVYAPYIREVFAHDEVAIEDLSLEEVDPLLQALRQLIELPKKNFERASVLELFAFPPFREKMNFSEADLRTIEEWCQEAHIHEWKTGMERLLTSLVETQSWIEQSELELFDTFYRIIASLPLDLMATKRTIAGWATEFARLLDTFFAVDPDADIVRHLRRFSVGFAHDPTEIAFESAERMLTLFMNRRSATLQPNHTQAIRFSSLPQGAVIPSEAIFLIGMHEDDFVRPSLSNSLVEFDLPYIPTRSEEDRFLFLQMLCSARKKLAISFPRTKPGETEDLSAALPVLELELPIEALTLQRAVKEKKEQILCAEVELPSVIELRKLTKLAKDPRKFFFHESLRIYEEEEEEESGEFIFSALKRYILCKEALKKPLETLLERADKSGQLPTNQFKEVALRRVESDLEQQLETLRGFGIEPSDVFSIKLSATCKKPERLPNGDWVFPPYVLKLGEKEVQLVGSIDEVTPKGLLLRSEGTLEDQIKVWPLYLVYRLLLPESGGQMLFLKKGKKRALAIQDCEKWLQSFVEYYAEALQKPSPLADALYLPLGAAYGCA